jgi:hypothetical protein
MSATFASEVSAFMNVYEVPDPAVVDFLFLCDLKKLPFPNRARLDVADGAILFFWSFLGKRDHIMVTLQPREKAQLKFYEKFCFGLTDKEDFSKVYSKLERGNCIEDLRILLEKNNST